MKIGYKVSICLYFVVLKFIYYLLIDYVYVIKCAEHCDNLHSSSDYIKINTFYMNYLLAKNIIINYGLS